MLRERCEGLKVMDHFFGMANDGSVWSYHGLRCVNCGAITSLQMGERGVDDAPHGKLSYQDPLRVQVMSSR